MLIDFSQLRWIRSDGAVQTRDGFHVTDPWGCLEGRAPVVLAPGWWRLEVSGRGSDRVEVEFQSDDGRDVFGLVVHDAPRYLHLAGGDYLFRIWPRRRPGVADIGIRLKQVGPLGYPGFLAHRLVSFVKRRGVGALVGRLFQRHPAGVGAGAVPAQGTPDADPLGPPDSASNLEARLAGVSGSVRVVIEAGHPQAVAASRRSMSDQLWPSWTEDGEAETDFVLFIEPGFELAVDGVLLLLEAARRGDLKAVYGDVAVAGQARPAPDWDPIYGAAVAYTAGVTLVRSSALAAVLPGNRGAHEILQRMSEAFGSDVIGHVSVPVASFDGAASLRPVEAGPSAQRTEGLPTVTAIIPTRDRGDLIETCLASLLELTTYPGFDVIILDNGSRDPTTLEILERWSRHPDCTVVRYDHPFNFSALCNYGASLARGEVLALINDDIVALESDWLSVLAAEAQKEGVGAVGPLLLYPDHTVQHAGVAVGIFGTAGHPWRGADPGDHPGIQTPASRTAVTAACLLVRRDAYEAVGGLDEGLPVTLNDIDFCLKLKQRGLQNVYRGDVSLLHYESQTRTPDHHPANVARRAAEAAKFTHRWASELQSDANHGAGLTRRSETGEAR